MKKYLKISLDDLYGLEEEQRKEFLDDLFKFGKRHKLSIDMVSNEPQRSDTSKSQGNWLESLGDNLFSIGFNFFILVMLARALFDFF